jgi:hypothetical protein
VATNTAILGPARDHACVRCGRRAESWQHRVSSGRNGPTDRFNCVPLCGDGTRGCHGWAEHNVAEARAVFLDVPGQFVRGRYQGPDWAYRLAYNGEWWDAERSDWVHKGVAPMPTAIRSSAEYLGLVLEGSR